MPTVDIYSKQQVDALIAGAGGLPDPTSASAGDVLTLDSNKDPAWAAVPDELPSTGSASAGDVLTLDSNKNPAWAAAGGGGGSGWTEIDLANLPTNFADGDLIKIQVNTGLTLSSSPSNWTASMTSTSGTLEKNTGGGHPSNILEFVLIAPDGVGSSGYAHFQIPRSVSDKYFLIMDYTIKTDPAYWNTQSANSPITIKGIVFNGASCKIVGTDYITRNDMISSDGVVRMWRKTN